MMGDLTKHVSSREELLREAEVSGHGNPTHTPQRASQRYVDVDDNSLHLWYAGTWHAEP
jgi:hypothetical protein